MRVILWIAVSSGRQAEDDKESLPEQERRLREVAEREGWEVVDLIRVPGHSRVYYNYWEFVEATEAEDIPGPRRMYVHWARKDFDVFACLDGSRFGREQSIFAEVVARTIDAGAELFTLKDGRINAHNQRMYVSMGGYAAASEVDELVRRRRMGMKSRAQKGLKVSARTLFGYREVRDGKGKVIRQEPDPQWQPLFDKLAFELLQGTPWYQLEDVLYHKYGFAHPRDGLAFPNGTFRSLVFSPTFWGHSAMGMGKRKGIWVFDEREPVPEGAQIWRNTHAPILSDALGQAVQEELLRRSEVVLGHASGRHTYAFSGLVICGACDTYMGMCSSTSGYVGMRCQRHFNRSPDIAQECTQNRSVNVKRIRVYAHALLEALLAAQDPALVFGQKTDQREALERLLRQIATEETALERMVAGLRTIAVENPAFTVYTGQIEQIGQRIQTLRQDFQVLEAQQKARERKETLHTLDELRQSTLSAFWELPSREINQKLHRILGSYKLVALDGDIIKLREVQGRRSRGTQYPSK